MNLSDLIALRKPGRKIEGHAAILLPFEADGSIAEKAYKDALLRTHDAGLGCAVNMDTGYANYLTPDERATMLRWAQDTLPDGYIAGVFVEGLEGDLTDLYLTQMRQIADHGGTPILFQTTRFHDWSPQQIIDLYATICQPFDAAYGFELGRMFAPNGMIYDEETIRGLIQIPALKGIKHSSLDRLQEIERLKIRDQLRPDFKIFTGNDLGIDMIEYGSDYLLGLAAFCPEKFAQRDHYWETSNPAYYELNDALQYLGNIAFRAPVPAYKHSCAVFQHRLNRIPTPPP
ncbi:MAG: dihydrodipicolinate synthase family protein, partial [Verrucomicrobiota bacterium]